MKLNWRQIYDFWALALESLVCLHLYRGNKKKITLDILRNIEYHNLANDALLVILFSFISITLLLFLYLSNPRILVLINTIMALIICSFLIQSRLVGCIIFIFQSVCCLPLFLHKNTELLRSYLKSKSYMNVTKKMMPLFFIFSFSKTIVSVIIFQVLVSINFKGHRFILFILINVVFTFAMTKKVMAETVLLFIHKSSDTGILKAIIGRILCIGTIALSSLVKPVFILIGNSEIEEYAMIYAIVHNETYFKSFGIVKKIVDDREYTIPRVYVRWLLYPFVCCSMYLAYRFFSKNFFFDSYELLTLIFYLHATIVESLYTFQSSIGFVIKTTARKEIISEIPV